ncbi:MAG: Rpn family recombination-promoting nuclease/putative transposase [Myxococcales bacterium]|nr:Rpn family recombination-promoting nuclease/putative transposase [Myxococcales bacterium]
MACLDPTLDLVFKLLLTREPRLLCDMLQGILAQPVPALTILDPDLPGERVGDRRVVFDIRAALPSGGRVDVEMQRRAPVTLESRLVYYTARHHGGQLRQGDSYHLLTPSTGIVWLAEPLFPDLPRLHSIFELRERHTGARLSDQLAIHLLQLPHLCHARSPSPSTGYTATVERWARFFAARTDAERHQLALEHPIMTLANQTLDAISQDSDAQRRARQREHELEFFYQLELAAHRAEARVEGRVEGKAELLCSLLSLRFGPLSRAARARIAKAAPEQLEAWAQRVLTAQTLEQVLAP